MTIPVPDILGILKIFLRRIGLLLVFIWALYFDGTHFAAIFPNAQWFTNGFMMVAFLVLYYRSVPRIRTLMLYAVVLGFAGEYLFSIVLEMYTYRLGNLPLYVPLGHTALYARVFSFSKAPVVNRNARALNVYLGLAIALIALGYWWFFNDVFGLVMTLGVFVLLWKRPKDRTFFFTMYLSVVFLEISGTYYEVWSWPSTAFGQQGWLPSNNPPSGISLFYFLLDVGCFVVYRTVHNNTWRRYKALKPGVN